MPVTNSVYYICVVCVIILFFGMVEAALCKEMSFLLDAKERQEDEQFKKLDQLIRQQQSFRKSAAQSGPVEKLKRLFLPA